MSEQVGSIHYDVTLETGKMVNESRVVTDSIGRLTKEGDKLNTSFNALALAAKVLAASFAVIKAAQLADDIRLMAARVQVAAGSLESGNLAMSRLIQISKTTQTAVAANVDVFNRLNQSLIQMGGTQDDTLRITELLGKAIKVSGASAVEAKGAMLQFGQALGSGKLQGDELRSLMENAPYLMKQLADGLGVPIGALKKLGEQGKLTSNVVVTALSKSAAKIEADFAKFPQTVGGAMQVASDAASRANEKFDTLTGSSAALTGVAKGTAEVFDEFTKQIEEATTEADKLGRNDSIKSWGDKTKIVLSYVVDAADMVWQTLSVLGRNVSYVFTSLGTEIGGIGAQIKAVATGDFAGAAAIHREMVADADQRRKELDAADAKTVGRAKLAGQKMRDAWDAAPTKKQEVRPISPLRGEGPDAKEIAKLAAKAEAAKAYYEGLVSENSFAMAKIDAEERKALADNEKRLQLDHANAKIYGAAKIEIQKKYARERAILEDKSTREIADLAIATTTDQAAKIEMVRAEGIRRADAAEKTGTVTHAEAERARTLATFEAQQARAELEDRNAKARADAAYLLTESTEGRILIVRDEAVRQAEDAYKRGALTFEEAESKKLAAARTALAEQKALDKARNTTVVETIQIRANAGGVVDQVALIKAQAAAELQANQEAWLLDLDASQIYADKKAAIETDMHARIAAARDTANQLAFTSTSDAFGAIAGVLKRADGEQSAVYKTMFAAQKAFAIASSIVAIQTGIAKAASEPFPMNIAAMASVAAATASIVSTISGTSYGGARQYGGPTEAGSLYRVNETGAPEMFTAANGNQFMLGGQSGNVTPADQVGGGGIVFAPTFHIDGTADKAAAMVQMQRVAGEANKQLVEHLRRMKVLPQG